MVINKHGSFYLRNGWGTKIIKAVDEDEMIFTPTNEQLAIDTVGLGRVMIKALRYWSVAMGLTVEEKTKTGIKQRKTDLFDYIDKNDPFFQKKGSLFLLHRNLSNNIDEATAWYWLFNEYNGDSISKDMFTESFHSFLIVNDTNIKKNAVEKEFNCLKNTYIGERKVDAKIAMDDDTYPFFAPLRILYIDSEKKIAKRHLTKSDIPLEVLMYCIAKDNGEKSKNCGQVNIEYLLEEKGQVGKYLNMKYSKLLEALIEAENKSMIRLNNNFGNKYIEFEEYDYDSLLDKYYKG